MSALLPCLPASMFQSEESKAATTIGAAARARQARKKVEAMKALGVDVKLKSGAFSSHKQETRVSDHMFEYRKAGAKNAAYQSIQYSDITHVSAQSKVVVVKTKSSSVTLVTKGNKQAQEYAQGMLSLKEMSAQ